jgi:hypothetical protein
MPKLTECPAPGGNRRRGGNDDAVGNGDVDTTELTEAQYVDKARRRWGHGIVLPPEVSAGPYAVVTYCDAEIVSLHPTLNLAAACLRELNEVGCAKPTFVRCCRFRRQAWRHQIVDLRDPPIMRIGDCDIWPEPNEPQQVAR